MRTLKEIILKEASETILEKTILKNGKVRPIVELLHLIIEGHNFGTHNFKQLEIYNSRLSNCTFASVRIQQAVLGEVWSPNTDFSWAVMEKADIAWSFLALTDFSRSQMPRSYFFETDFTGANFAHADLTASSFVNCKLSGADFSGAKTHLVRFDNCVMKDTVGLCEDTMNYAPMLFTMKNW